MLETRPSGAEKAWFCRNSATPCATFNQNSTKRCFDSVVERCFDSVVEQCLDGVVEQCSASVGSVPERCSVCVPQMALGQCA